MIKFPDFLQEIVAAGIDITLCKNEKYGFMFDLNLCSKNDMVMVWDEEKCAWAILIEDNDKFYVYTANCLKSYVRLTIHERYWISPEWVKFINE